MVLDSLCKQLFDFHFIEPMMKYQDVVKVRPNFKKIVVDAIKNPMAFIKDKLAGKNKLLPIDMTRLTNSSKGLRSLAPAEIPKDVKPIVELSTDLKIEVGRFSFEKRPVAQQCAEVLELILQAVVQKKDKIKAPVLALPPSTRVNKVGQAKMEQENKDKQDQLKKEQLRKKREKEVKEQLKKAKEEKDRLEQEKLQEIQDKAKSEIAKKQELEQKKIAAQERKKKQLEDAKKAKQEEAEQKLKEQKEMEEQKLLDQKKKNKQFLKQQNQKLKEQFENNKKERSEIEKRQAELEIKEKEKQQKMKQEMVDFLSKNKDFRKLEEKERQEIHNFYMTDEVQELMTTYESCLTHMYKYYTLQGKVTIGGNLEKMMNVIEFNNWVKLGYNTNITPHLITSDDMVAIYRTLEREFEFSVGIDDKDDQIHYIDYEHFKKGLIRITILAKTQSIEAEVKNRQRRSKKTKKSKNSEETASTLKSSKLKNLEEQIAKLEKMQKMKVEDKRISKEFDVSMISKDDVERFFKFLQFEPADDKYKMDKKITNKEGYPKSIIFEGLEGNYSEVYSQRDLGSSYNKARDNDDKYSVIHGKGIAEENEVSI